MSATLEKSLRPPRQERSRRTLERILDALEALMETAAFEDVTVQQVVTRARVSVGSFYARFPTKEALLPALYDRWDREVRRRSVTERDHDLARRLGLERLTRRFVSRLVRRQRQRRWFMRSVALHARRHPEMITPAARRRRTELHREWCSVFLVHRERIRHPEPEQAVAMAMFVVVTAAREKVVFSDAPHAASFRLSDRKLVDELVRVFLAYLGVAAPRREVQ